MDAGNYALNKFDKHLARVGWGRVVLEGRLFSKSAVAIVIATAVIAYAYGTNAILLDVGPFAKKLPSHAMLYVIYWACVVCTPQICHGCK